ncbi:hypothetical protein V6Z11_A12G296100 [Gossypium hirsutum]
MRSLRNFPSLALNFYQPFSLLFLRASASALSYGETGFD